MQKLQKGVVTHGTPCLAQQHRSLAHVHGSPQPHRNAATGMGAAPGSAHRQDIVYVGPPSSAFAVELPLRFPVFEPLITALPPECVLGRVTFMG